MDRHKIIMNFTVPPDLEDLESIARDTMAGLPEELIRFCENLVVQIEDFPDETVEAELELENSYALIALFRSGNQLSPGVKSKTSADDDTLILYRRPLLDMWCETGDDLNNLVRQVMIEELAQNFDFSDEDIEAMVNSAHHG